MIFGIGSESIIVVVIIDIVDHVRNVIDIEYLVSEFAVREWRVLMAMIGGRRRCSKTSKTKEDEEVKRESVICKGEHCRFKRMSVGRASVGAMVRREMGGVLLFFLCREPG